MSGPQTPANAGPKPIRPRTPAKQPSSGRTKAIAGGGGVHTDHYHVVDPNISQTQEITTTVEETTHRETGPMGIRRKEITDIKKTTTTTQSGNINDGRAERGDSSTHIGGGIVVYDSHGAPVQKPAVISSPARKKKAVAPHSNAAVTAAPAVSALPAQDAIIISSADAPLERGNLDKLPEDANATQDAEKLAKAAAGLQKQLKDLGLAGNSDLFVKGLEQLAQVDKLAVVLQRDYTGTQESTIQVDFRDRRDASFNRTVTSIDVTHDNVEQLTCAFTKASEAVKTMVSNVSPGQSVTQEDIKKVVFNALKTETQELSH